MKIKFLPMTFILLLSIISLPVKGLSDDEDDNSFPSGLRGPNSNKILADVSFDEYSEEAEAEAEAEATQLLRGQPWFGSFEKIVLALGHLDPVEFAEDFNVLVEAAKSETTPLQAKSSLAITLIHCGTEKTLEAATQLNRAIALAPTLVSETRIDALEDIANLPGNEELADELYTTLARDKTFSLEERYGLAHHFIDLKTRKGLEDALRLYKIIFQDAQYPQEMYAQIHNDFQFTYAEEQPELFQYAQRRAISMFGRGEQVDIARRFRFISEAIRLSIKDYGYNLSSEIEFFSLLRENPTAKKIWNSMIEKAKKEPSTLQELQNYLAELYSDIEVPLEAL